MKLLKTDKKYEYYELTGEEQAHFVYYSSFVVAISKLNLYRYGLRTCMINGKAMPCSYSYEHSRDPMMPYYVDIHTIKIEKDYLKIEAEEENSIDSGEQAPE